MTEPNRVSSEMKKNDHTDQSRAMKTDCMNLSASNFIEFDNSVISLHIRGLGDVHPVGPGPTQGCHPDPEYIVSPEEPILELR